MNTYEKVTMLKLSAFGTSVIECRSVGIYNGPYAQHANAVHVEFVEKGKRKKRGFVETGDRSIVIVRGFDIPKPADVFEHRGDGSGITRFSSFAPEWRVEHDAYVRALKESGIEILADTREEAAP